MTIHTNHYFPDNGITVDPEEIRAGYYSRLAAAQGTEGIYHVGVTASMEGYEAVLRQVETILPRLLA